LGKGTQSPRFVWREYNPMASPTPTALITLGGVVLCWIIFASVFLLRKRNEGVQEAKRDRAAGLGVALQMCAYAVAWFQPPRSAFLPPRAALAGSVGIAFGAFTVAIAIASVWLVGAAVRSLGKQWAVAARLVGGHKLITIGPYRFVRNPIYTGMLGMLIATGLAMEHWIALGVAIVLFMIGLFIRVHTEEKLLRVAFGEEFEEYAKRVPAVLPGIY
jgi:protein-S-isoprenylcysteine O-methyltransferase Ste14